MIRIICVGKIKETYFREALLEYQKRLSKYTKLELIEVSDVSTDCDNVTMEKEMELVNKYLQEKDYIITLEIDGVQMDSLTFSKKIEMWEMHYHDIVFIIGGSVGIHPLLKERAKEHLSFSKMTFPHQLFRILLLEQIYRAYKIKNHETYHK